MNNKAIDTVLTLAFFFLIVTIMVIAPKAREEDTEGQPPPEMHDQPQYFGIPGGPDFPDDIERPLEQPKLIGTHDY